MSLPSSLFLSVCLPKTATEDVKEDELDEPPKKPRQYYTRVTLLRIYESPLVKAPEGMRDLSSWYSG
jgi:hypothetical protein